MSSCAMKKQFFTKNDLTHYLSDLEAAPGDFITMCFKPAFSTDQLDMLSPEHAIHICEIKESINTEAVVQGARRYGTGAVIFWSEVGSKHIILPPFPVTESKVLTGKIDTSVLREILERQCVIGVVLVTWGSYAIGIYDAGNMVESKVGTGYIHKKHRKGGRSEKRFARRTEEQKRDFLRRVGNRVDERFAHFTVDYIFFGGNRLIGKPLLQECRYLQARSDRISPRVLDVRYADREALANSLHEITKSLVFSF